jgi:flagellar biosynthesis protein FlhA
MFEESRLEYAVKTCPTTEPDELEILLNEMADEGWELYMLHEADSGKGIQYNCIFSREYDAEDEMNGSEVADVLDFKSKMEKMILPSDEPYEECKEIQANINLIQEEITKIKKLLDSSAGDIDYQTLNEEISTKLRELNELKADLADVINPTYMYERVNQDKLTLIISDELMNLVDDQHGIGLISETVKLRQNLADKLGYIIPAIRFTDSDTLEANEFRIDIRGSKVLSGFVHPEYIRFYEGQANISRKPKTAIEDIDPVTGNRVFWIAETKTKDFWENGLNPVQVITNSLEHIVCKYVNEILDYTDINNYIGIVGTHNLFLVENIIPDELSIGDIRQIFADLIKEKVSIKDIVYVFERLNDFIQDTETKDKILEKLRVSLKRHISSSIADVNNNIYGIILNNEYAETLEDLLVQDENISYFMPKEQKSKKLIKKVMDIVRNSDFDISNTALIVPAFIRKQLFNIFEQIIPGLAVITSQEIAAGYNLEIIDTIS